MSVRDGWGTDPARTEWKIRRSCPLSDGSRSAARQGGLGLASRACAVHDESLTGPGMLTSSGMALKKQPTPKRWRSKEAKEIVAAVQRAGGQVERTASGHLKVIGPAGAAIVASAPNTGRAGGRAVHNTLATIRSKTGLQV